MVEKRRFFGGKKVKITITETGKNLLGIKHEELKQNKQKLEQLYESGDKQQLQTYMDSNRSWMPYMLFSGLMNVLFFTSMMSFMGMAMTPSESAVADNSGSSSDASDTAGTDNQADLVAHPMQQMLAEALTAEALTAEALTAEALISRDILSRVIHGFQSHELYNRLALLHVSTSSYVYVFLLSEISVNNDSSIRQEFYIRILNAL